MGFRLSGQNQQANQGHPDFQNNGPFGTNARVEGVDDVYIALDYG